MMKKGIKMIKAMCKFHLISVLCSPVFAISMVDPATPSGAIPFNGDTSWTLDFSDEFNGTSLDTTKWGIDVSTSTRGPRPERGIDDWWWVEENVYLDGAGSLVLDVVKADHNTMHCGSVSSDGLYEPLYGYLEARIRISDTTKDTHTAFWMQSENMYNGTPPDGTANDGAEVDFFESAWFGDRTSCPVHIDGYGADKQAFGYSYNVPGIHSGYHTFGVEWNAHVMSIYYDGFLKAQHQGIWVPHVPEFLWLSDGASFGDIGTFLSEPVGWLSDAKFDYVRVWKPAVAPIIYVVGGSKMNGNFNSEPGASVTFNGTPGWYNLGTSNSQADPATKDNVTYDGSQNAVVPAAATREFGLNTGYEMVEGDIFDISYVWKDDWNWVDATDRIRVTLFVTSDDTITGTRTDLISALSGVSTMDNTYEVVDDNGIYTATASDAGKVVFVAIDGNDSGSGGFARLDNFELIRHMAVNQPPAFTSDPFSKANATEDIAYSGSIAGDVSDSEGDPMTFQKVSGAAWLTVASDGTLGGTPTQADVDAGVNQFTVQVDAAGGSDAAILYITVDNVNDAPVYTVDPINEANATEGSAFSGSVANATDADGDTLTYSKTFGPAWLNVASDGTLSGTPGAGDVGANSWTVQVSDGNGGTNTATLNITVDAAAGGPTTIVGGSTLNGNFNSPGTAGTISFTAEGNWIALSGNQTATFLNDVVANAYDGHYAQLSEEFVANPALDTGYAIAAGDVFDVSFLWHDGWNWNDAGDQLLLTLYVTDDNTVTGAQTVLANVYSGASTLDDTYELVDQNGVYSAGAALAGKTLFIGLQTQDGNGNANGYVQLDNLELVVAAGTPPTNNAPVFTVDPINEANATEGSAYSGSVANATDTDGDTLTYSLVSAQTWLNVASDGTLSGTPGAGDAGLNVFTVQVSDGNGGTDTATLNITVDAAPMAAVHVSSIVPSVAAAGGPNKYGVATVKIVDQNDQPVSGASVSGTFTGSYSEIGSAVADANGVALIQTVGKTKNPSFTFTVDNVTASGYSYDSAANVETSDSY